MLNQTTQRRVIAEETGQFMDVGFRQLDLSAFPDLKSSGRAARTTLDRPRQNDRFLGHYTILYIGVKHIGVQNLWRQATR
jgi:hypothetical protein